MAGKEIHCPWQTWLAPGTSHLKAGLIIVIIYLWEITLSQFTINYSCLLGHPLQALHQQHHDLLRRWHVLSKLMNLRNITLLQFRHHRHAASHFANLLDSSKFFIFPSMLAFFGVMFTLNIQLWNTIRMRWDITPLHNVHFVKYVYLPTEQAETYLKRCLLINYSTYICLCLFGWNVNLIFKETMTFKL